MTLRFFGVKGNWKFFFDVSLFRLLLDISLVFYITAMFERSGYGNVYTKASFNVLLYILSWGLLLLYSVVAYDWFVSQKPSRVVLIFLYYINYIPLTSLIGLNCLGLSFFSYCLLYWFVLGFLSMVFKSDNDNCEIIENRSFIWISTVICVLTVGYFLYKGGVHIDLNIFNAYDYRNLARTVSRATVSTYLLGFSRIMIPTCLAYAVLKKNWKIFLVYMVLAVLNYSYDGSKTLYFISLASVFVGCFYKNEYLLLVPKLLNGFMLIGFAEDIILGTTNILRLIIRRLFYVPNVINSAYFDYMKDQPPNLYMNLLRFIGIKSQDVSFVIGRSYFASQTMSANTGTIGDSLWQFKYFGFFIHPVLLVVLLVLLDKTALGVPDKMMIIPALVFAYYLNNSSLTAACFSHGLLAFCLVMNFYVKGRKRILYSDNLL